MATLVIRNLDPALHARLKTRAAAQGRSMEEEARRLLREGLAAEPLVPETNWVDAIRALFEPLGGLDLPEMPREPAREPPDFSGPEWADFDKR
jgi:antitoxin FitA